MTPILFALLIVGGLLALGSLGVLVFWLGGRLGQDFDVGETELQLLGLGVAALGAILVLTVMVTRVAKWAWYL